MENLIKIFYGINFLLGDPRFVFIVTIIALLINTYLIKELLQDGIVGKRFQIRRVLIFLVIISSIIIDFSWLLKFCQVLFFPKMDYRVVLFVIRIAWGFFILQYQALSLLIDKLPESDDKISFVYMYF